jgi:DNA-binding NarL/FixJ family response regulator
MKALLIDDHTLFRDALGLLIEARFPQLTLLQTGSLAGALAKLAQHPDLNLLLLDLNLPDAQGLDGLRLLRDQAPTARLVVLSADDRPETVAQAIALGASGFVPKTARSDMLASALATTLAGGVYLPPSSLLAAPPMAAGAGPALALSPRQADVLRLLIEGQSNKLICRTLALSESSVKTHVAAVFRRLDVNSRTQAVVAAARLGLRLNG